MIAENFGKNRYIYWIFQNIGRIYPPMVMT